MGTLPLREYFSRQNIPFVLDMLEFHYLYEELSENNKYQVIGFDILPAQEKWKQCEDLGVTDLSYSTLEELKQMLSLQNKNICIYTRYPDMIKEFLDDNHLPVRNIIKVKSHLYKSFSQDNDIYICDDIIEKIFIKKRVKKKLSADIDLLLKIQSGDYIVHIDHGIGVFDGIIKKTL
jgi:transcription-repair coupling factor (superfamily II helicase)